MNSEMLPDDALVVRGGRSSPTDIQRSIFRCESGDQGIAVVTGIGMPLEELCESLPHSVIRCTTVGSVRNAGGDILRIRGRNPYSAVLIGLCSIPDIQNTYGPTAPSKSDCSHFPEGSQMSETTSQVRVFADFNNADRLGRVRLNTQGTYDDLRALAIELYDGMSIILDDQDEIVASAIVRWDEVEGFVAEVDWSKI